MTRLILKRLGIGIVTVLAVSVIIFFGTKILPGDAAQIRLGQSATPENVAAFRERLGLDQPYIVQYMSWLKNFMTGDLGNSLASDVPIVDLIADRYKNTVFVSLLTAAIGVPISLALGILAAMYPGTFYDRVLTFVSVSLVAAPEFFTATLLVLFFVFVLDVGNAIGLIVIVVTLNLAYLVTGVIVVEVYFGYNGLATLIVQGVQTRDYVLIQGLGMIFCMTYVILMLIADIAAFASNARLRHPK